MADPVNGANAPALNDVEMKEEMTEPSVHSIPSAALDQSQMAVQAAASLPINQEAPPTHAAPQHQAMEGIINGQPQAPAAQASVAQAPPPVAQPPLASPLPATAAAPPPPPPAAQLPVSAPTPPPAPQPSRPSSIPPSVSLPPEKPHPHGSPTRVYLNQAVTPHLLEGMKYLAAYEPEKPLKWLSEFLAKRSAEVEGES